MDVHLAHQWHRLLLWHSVPLYYYILVVNGQIKTPLHVYIEKNHIDFCGQSQEIKHMTSIICRLAFQVA